jgi:hypothetical protein
MNPNSRQNARRKATFRIVKGHLLQHERRHIANSLTVSHLQQRQHAVLTRCAWLAGHISLADPASRGHRMRKAARRQVFPSHLFCTFHELHYLCIYIDIEMEAATSDFNLLNSIKYPADLRKLGVEQLPRLCKELRDDILKELSVNPGHMASSMGTVELTVALHYVYDTPEDRIVWDVGHH